MISKITHLTSVHLRYDIRIFLKMCTSLAVNNYQVSLVVADGKGDEEKNGVAIYDVFALTSYFLCKIHNYSKEAKHKIKDGWTKYVLRKAMNGILPDEIIWRKNKLGFNAPEKTWIDSMGSEMKDSIDKSEIIKSLIVKNIPYGSLDRNVLWRLYSIAIWEKQFNVKYE
jgi:hypothetical protein